MFLTDGSSLGVDLLLFVQHRHVLLDASCPRLWLFGVLDPVQDRIPVPAVEGIEELPRYLVLLEFSPQIVGHSRPALRFIGRLPPTVRSSPLDLPQAGGLHPARLDQLLDLLAVDPRPLAPGPARGEPLQPVLSVEGLRLAVNPAVAQRNLQGLRLGDSLDAGALLGDLEPQPLRVRMVLVEPRFPTVAGGERDDRQARLGGHKVSFQHPPPRHSASAFAVGAPDHFYKGRVCRPRLKYKFHAVSPRNGKTTRSTSKSPRGTRPRLCRLCFAVSRRRIGF